MVRLGFIGFLDFIDCYRRILAHILDFNSILFLFL